MDLIIACVFVLVFIAVSLVLLAIFQIRMAGIKIKDFYGFIQANQMLDKLARFARRYENMSPQEQVIYLKEAEKKYLKHMIKFQQQFGKTNIENTKRC